MSGTTDPCEWSAGKDENERKRHRKTINQQPAKRVKGERGRKALRLERLEPVCATADSVRRVT